MGNKNTDNMGFAQDCPLERMQKLCHWVSKAKGWYDCQCCDGTGTIPTTLPPPPLVCPMCRGTGIATRNIPEMLCLIHSEVSEALEAYRDREKHPAHCYQVPDSLKPEGMGIELADVVIRVMDLCEYLQIDLAAMIVAKHAYNMTRPHRHGGKVC